MWAFFHGWRRKAGVATLVMAAVFMVGWVRSLVLDDVITIEHGNIADTIQSSDGSLTWERAKSRGIYQYGFQWQSGPDFRSLSPWVRTGIEPQIDWGGVELGKERVGAPPHFGWIILPFWFITAPLTLLSAVLILWPQRKRPQTSPVVQSRQE